MGILDNAKQAAEAHQANTTNRELEMAHSDVTILVGENAKWLEQLMTEADEAKENEKLGELNAIEDVLREVKLVFDHYYDTASDDSTTLRASLGLGDRARAKLNRPGPNKVQQKARRALKWATTPPHDKKH